jgi:DNA (cytosine-5)-methyltransferase 1
VTSPEYRADTPGRSVERNIGPLVVVDLFCGAGGFSEGFRQAGLRVSCAVDNWHPAVATHQHNHPETRTLERDVLSLRPSELGRVDVLIGSPPCTEFSMSNNAGRGDVEAGMNLVYRFLYFVAVLRPRWWVMENVPRVLRHLPEAGGRVPYVKLGLKRPGGLLIPRVVLLASAAFGVPQQRIRAFVGEFPEPAPTKRKRTLGDVVRGLPDPLGLVPAGRVQDPVYGATIDASELTDHFGQWWRLREPEVRENRDLKSDHGFYGRMAFPDDLERPARTQMASIQRIAREATVVRARPRVFRLLTVRETASVQGFPLTYQWVGRTVQERYRLIGNAVAPPVAFSVASAIRRAADLPIARRPELRHVPAIHHGDEQPRDLTRVRGSLGRSFHWHVPGVRHRGYRIELDNLGCRRSHPTARGPRGGRLPHLRSWRAVLHHGTGQGYLTREYTPHRAIDALRRSGVADVLVGRFVAAVTHSVQDFPDATTLQSAYANRTPGQKPKDVLRELGALVDRYFPVASTSVGTRGHPELPIRVAAALVACSIACEWINAGPTQVEGPDPYIPQEWTDRGVSLQRERLRVPAAFKGRNSARGELKQLA